jgi:hypothetical protein
MSELERREEDEVLEDGLYFDPVEAREVMRRALVGIVLMSAVVERLEARGIAPAATRALRAVLPRVDWAALRDAAAATE